MIVEFGTLFGTMLLAMALGLPVFLCLGAAAGVYTLVFWPKVPLMVLAQGFVQGLDNYSFIAIVFFFLAGEIMTAGGINDRLMRFANACAGHLRGGLSHVNILANMVFAGVSGSAVADASAVGSVMIPAMRRQGYSGPYIAAVTAAAATIGPVIPPSIPLVMFGLFAMTSVGKLFLAGVVPGLLMGAFLLAASWWISRRRSYPATPWVGWAELGRTLVGSASALVMPVIIIIGIVGGVATVTEVGAIAAAYAAAVSLLYREVRAGALWQACVRTGIDSCKVLIILSVAGLFVWIVGNMGVAKVLAQSILAVTRDPMLVLALIAGFLLVAGCLLESVTLLVVFVPLLIPTARAVGIDMIHLGVVSVLATLLGLITPPVGVLIFVTAAQTRSPAHQVVRELVPFIFALVLLLAVLVIFPGLSTWLPRLLLG